MSKFGSRFVILFVLLTTPSAILAPSDAHPSLPQERGILGTADRVQDLLFPRSLDTKFFVVLRFLPSDAPDSQIVITSHDEQNYEIVYARARKNVFHEVNRILSSGVRDEASIAKQIPVDVQTIEIPRKVLDSWLSAFYGLTMATKPHNLVVVDGTIHELWFQTSNGEKVCFEYNDPFDGSEKSHPIVQWMNRVSADVKKYANQSPTTH